MSVKTEGHDHRTARRAARAVQAYWRAQGHPEVLAWVETSRVPVSSTFKLATIYCVRSNLVAGRPPR